VNLKAFAALAILFVITSGSAFGQQPEKKWAIAIHGGAGRLDPEMTEEKKAAFNQALENALNVGKAILQDGGTSLDAVQATVANLEDCELFNAGKGATYNRDGFHELDASIMDGSNLNCGAVAMVRKIKNPIKAARLVMEKTPHVLLCGPEADDFAKSNDCELVKQGYYFTARRFRGLQRSRKRLGLEPLPGTPYELSKEQVDSTNTKAKEKDPVTKTGGSTVGCVALDQHGNLAAATSTGGMTAKLGGRVGDSPIIGAGTYANGTVAVSGTGIGEQYIRHSIAARVAMLMEMGNLDVDAALDHCLTKVLKPNDGGLIAVDKDGNISLQASTGAMSRGAADSSGRFETKLWMNEE
jgi:beta-aspartyl-peptidase (threonine type)